MSENKIGDAPVFVKIEDYKDILNTLEHIKDSVEEAKKVLVEINELKSNEDSHLEMWNDVLGEIEQKIESIDEDIFEQSKG